MSEVYKAINMYLNCGKHHRLKDHYIKVYNWYKSQGGKYSLEYFESTVDDYIVRGCYNH